MIMDRIESESLMHAEAVIVDPANHQDAVSAAADDFSQGAYWMLGEVCGFLKKEMHDVCLFSGNDGKLTEAKLSVVTDDSSDEFVVRLRGLFQK